MDSIEASLVDYISQKLKKTCPKIIGCAELENQGGNVLGPPPAPILKVKNNRNNNDTKMETLKNIQIEVIVFP